MQIHLISIFPEIFDSFLSTSLISKAIDQELITVSRINPREFCTDKHQQVDDEIYGGGAGLLLKAQPVIDAVRSVITQIPAGETFRLIYLAPSEQVFTQQVAHELTSVDHLIVVMGRYE